MAESLNLEAVARRAVVIGELRFLAGDVAGARQCTQYTLNSAPGLPGTDQVLVAYDVHSAAARGPGPSPGGVPDWYAVLVLPLSSGGATDVTHDDIKRQHRRLCLLVHPDKKACPSRLRRAAGRLSPAADDVTPPRAPKQPPIARPTPSWASPPAGQPAPAPAVVPRLAQPPISWMPPGEAAPPPGLPERPPQRPSCPLLPFSLFCRPFTAGPGEGFSVHDELPTREFREFGAGDDYYH